MAPVASLVFAWDFILRHPGLLLVLIGVTGEVYFDWHEMSGRRGIAKRASAIVLIIGLIIEFGEAAKSDKEVAALNLKAEQSGRDAAVALKESAEANERAAKFDADRVLIAKQAEEIRSTNFVLQAKVLELEGAMQPRMITQAQHVKFVGSLQKAPKEPVWILYSNPTGEMKGFASQLRKMLDEAGYTAEHSDRDKTLDKRVFTGFGSDEGIFNNPGLQVTGPEMDASVGIMFNLSGLPAHGEALVAAFREIGIKTSLVKGGDNVMTGQVAIIVLGKRGF
jgi:hypothetical protein